MHRPQCTICGFEGPSCTAATCPSCRDQVGHTPTRAVDTFGEATEAAVELRWMYWGTVIIVRFADDEQHKFNVSAVAVERAQFFGAPNAKGGDVVLFIRGKGAF